MSSFTDANPPIIAAPTDPLKAAQAASLADENAAAFELRSKGLNSSAANAVDGAAAKWSVYETLLLPALKRALRARGKGALRQVTQLLKSSQRFQPFDARPVQYAFVMRSFCRFDFDINCVY